MFFELFGAYVEGNTMGSTKKYYYYKIQYMIKIIQKLGHHGSNLYSMDKRNSEHGFFELR